MVKLSRSANMVIDQHKATRDGFLFVCAPRNSSYRVSLRPATAFDAQCRQGRVGSQTGWPTA